MHSNMEWDRAIKFNCRGEEFECFLSTEGVKLNLMVQQTSRGLEWRGNFSSRYIEQITSKSGNSKTFTQFLKFLTACLEEQNPCYYLNFLTFQDIENLRSRKRLDTNFASQSNKKRYLILSYTSEFEKVHYPLPLALKENYMPQSTERQIEESVDLQESIEELQNQNNHLKQQLEMLKKEKESLSSEYENYKQETQTEIEKLKVSNDESKTEMQRFKQELDSIIEELEKKSSQKKSVTYYKHQVKTLQKQLEESQSQISYYKEQAEFYKSQAQNPQKEESFQKEPEKQDRDSVVIYTPVQANSPISNSELKLESLKNQATEASLDLTDFENKLGNIHKLLAKYKS